MIQDSPKANLLKALHRTGPSHVPFAGEGAYRLVDHVGRKPPRAGRDEWGVVWAPLPASYEPGPAEPAESYAVTHPAQSVTEALALPLPGGCDPACFSGLFDREDLLGLDSLWPLSRRRYRSSHRVRLHLWDQWDLEDQRR